MVDSAEIIARKGEVEDSESAGRLDFEGLLDGVARDKAG